MSVSVSVYVCVFLYLCISLVCIHIFVNVTDLRNSMCLSKKFIILCCFFSALALPDEDGLINPFAKKYRKSEEYSRLKADLDETLKKAKSIPVTTPRTYAINYFWQVSHVIVQLHVQEF